MKLKGLFVLDEGAYGKIYGPEERRDIAAQVDLVGPAQTGESVLRCKELLAGVDVIFSGWGAPVLDEGFLAQAPKLQAFFYGAGSVRYCVTDAVWARNIIVTSAYAANAVPVSEFTLAAVLFGLKHVWPFARGAAVMGRFPARTGVPGAYGSTVGLVSLGMIGRRVAERLKALDVKVLAYDPFLAAADARALNVQSVSLEAVFREADVVSLHTPLLPQTRGLITGQHIASMKEGATFINTARGAVVRETEMIEVLRRRPDLTAMLDVTDPEPPPPGSPMYSLPNVMLTPHLAGSVDAECRRMGRYMVDELGRFLGGKPLHWQITRELAARLA